MKTVITRSRGIIALVVDDRTKEKRERDVLAAMTLSEGTGCWSLVDFRLARHNDLSPYSGSCLASDFHATFKPDNAEEALFIKSKLREYSEDEDGTLHWCTFVGIVRGKPEVNGYCPPGFNQAGYFSQKEGVEKIKEIKMFWDNYEGNPKEARIENPHLQMTESEIFSAIFERRFYAKEALKSTSINTLPRPRF